MANANVLACSWSRLLAFALCTAGARQEKAMDKDRVQGGAKQVKGSVKEAIGKVTGDTKTGGEGKLETTAGKVQSGIGKAKDAIRNAFKK
jgi:uncharacterized protein YjbJ (UPF0337 family)